MDHLQSVVMPRLRMAMRQGALVAILGAAVQATTAATPHMGPVSPSRAYVNHGFRAPASVACEKVPGFVWVEAESFADYGGWVVDTQFTHKMGSAYLICPGANSPTERPARTEITIPRAGTWRAWGRTKD